jgi:hypothetical protein
MTVSYHRGESVEGQADNDNTQASAGVPAGSDQPTIPSTDTAGPPVASGSDMHRGWFKIWRKWRDHELAQDPNGWLVFTHILCEVRRQAKYNRSAGITVEPGECDLTQQQLSEATKLSRKAIRAALGRLERYETIETRPSKGQRQGHKRNIITVLNWHLYNGEQEDRGQSPEQNGAPKGPTKVPSPKKGKKGEKKNLPTLRVDQKFARVILPMVTNPSDVTEGQLCRIYHQLTDKWSKSKVMTAYEQARDNKITFKDHDHAQAWFVTALRNLEKAGPTDRSTAVSQQHQRGLDSDEYGL